jgi:cytochrome P450
VSTTGPLQDDLLTPDLTADPHPAFARLRAEDPVHWSATHRAWLITRYDDVAAASNDPHLSSDRVRPLLAKMAPERRAAIGPVFEMIGDWMVVSDPPAHARLRKLATSAFHPKRFVAMEDRIRELVDVYIDEYVASGEEDLVAHYAFPLPATVICELIGAPVADADKMKGWSQELALVAFGAGGDARDDRHARALRGLEEMLAYFGELIDRARERPPGGHDMISSLLEGDGSGERLSDEEMKGMCALMLFAGHETSMNTITSTVYQLLRNPDQLALLRADPKLAGKAVEEGLRIDGAIKVLQRWVVENFTLRGKDIRAGERVFLLLSAANRDPERFADPDRFDLLRSPNPHVAFGKGIHTCIGAMLARLEMRIAVARLIERLPHLRLADEAFAPEWLPSIASRAMRELPLRHDG